MMEDGGWRIEDPPSLRLRRGKLRIADRFAPGPPIGIKKVKGKRKKYAIADLTGIAGGLHRGYRGLISNCTLMARTRDIPHLAEAHYRCPMEFD